MERKLLKKITVVEVVICMVLVGGLYLSSNLFTSWFNEHLRMKYPGFIIFITSIILLLNIAGNIAKLFFDYIYSIEE